MQLAFGSWSPDSADFGTDTLDVARNVYPAANSWKPAPSPVAVSNALPSGCKGTYYVQLTDGSYATYAGTATKLYKFNSATLDFDDVSRLAGGDYNVADGEYWQFATFGTYLIAVHLGDVPQVINVDVGANFAALAGSPPNAKFITVIDDRVVLGHLSTNPRAVQWSDINDMEEWSGGVADGQEFTEHGAVQGVFAHARLILLERGVRSIVSTGDAGSFQFPELTSQKGTIAPYASVEVGTLLFWLSDEGFYLGNADQQKSFSHNRFSNYFLANVNQARIGQIYGAFDPFAPRVLFAYPTGDNAYNDRILGYDWSLDKPFELDVATYVLSRTATPGITLEGGADSTNLDLPGLLSFDSRAYMGGVPALGCIGTDLKLAYFDGPALQPTFETGTFQFVPGRRSRLRSAELFVEGADGDLFTLVVKKRSRLKDNWAVSSAITQQASGRYPLCHDGMFHRFEWTAPAGAVWDHVQASNVDFVPTSWR